MQKLTDLREGQKARIIGITGDRRYLSRITSIGLNIGCPLETVSYTHLTLPTILLV